MLQRNIASSLALAETRSGQGADLAAARSTASDLYIRVYDIARLGELPPAGFEPISYRASYVNARAQVEPRMGD